MNNNTAKKENLSSSSKFKEAAKTVYMTKNGKLNKVSIGLSALILIGLLALTGFTVYKTDPSTISNEMTDILDSEEARTAIQQAFVDGINQYLDGSLTEEEALELIAQMIQDYLEADGTFTDVQKEEINNLIAEYLKNLNIEDLISSNAEQIDYIESLLNNYISQNDAALELLKSSILEEINNNKQLTDEQLASLQSLYDQLSNLELSHFNNVNTYIQNTYNELHHYTTEIEYNLYNGTSSWEAGAEYQKDALVIYQINDDGDVRIYRNLTGYNTDTPPNQDTTNWEEVSITETINNNYLTIIHKLYAGIEEWSADAEYTPNTYVMYNNVLYRNVTGTNTSTSPDKDTTNWVEASITDVIVNNYNTFLSTVGASDYDPNQTYAAGQYVIYNNMIYKCVAGNGEGTATGITPGTDSSVWEALSLTTLIDSNYTTFLNTMNTEDYNPEHTYLTNATVIYENNLYRAKKDVPAGVLPTDETYWEQISITTLLNDLQKQVNAINNEMDARYTDNDANLIFGYQDGVYGYYTDSTFSFEENPDDALNPNVVIKYGEFHPF